MANDTSKSSSEKQQSAVSVETMADRGNKLENHGTTLKGDRPDKTEKPEEVDATKGSEKQGMVDEVAQNCATECPGESPKPEALKRDDGNENPSQSGTTKKPEHSSTLPKKESQSRDNANKRLRFGPSQRNKSGPRAKNGSYHNYYNRRYNGIHGDDRLPIVRDAVKLQGKNLSLLDVGCNDGTMTIEMASLDRCIEAVGIDIDPNLVGAARKKLRRLAKIQAKKTQAELENPNIQGPVPKLSDALPLSLRRSLQLMKEVKDKHKEDGMDPERTTNVARFPHNVTFRREDFTQKAPTRTSQEVGKYDVVLCLSVTKWVHFAGGDEALKRLFRRLHACLKPGGVLILEPQPQKSYKSAIRKGLGKKDFKGERKLKPPKFAEYLTKTVGFKRTIMLRDVRHRGQAFNRPIISFYKQHAVPPSTVGTALSRHADLFLGVLPSDDDGSGQQQQKEGEEKKDAINEHADNDAEACAERHTQEVDRKERKHEPPQAASAEPSRAEVDSSETKAKAKDDCLLARDVEKSTAKTSENPAVVPSSSGSKKRSTSQELEEIKPQSPKRVKRDPEEKKGQTSFTERSIAEGNASEIKPKAMDNCQLTKDVKTPTEKVQGDPAVVLHSSGSKRKSNDEEIEGINAQNRKRARSNKEEPQSEPKSPPHGATE